mgnify:CR=1 FL=1
MDFNAKRLALLAGVGNPEDRHVIVQEQAQQLNESIEARQISSGEEDVRKAVRRTIQKMVSEGALNLQEDSIARELEHLRANIQADHDHIAALVDDMHDDKDEIERAEHHREEMHEEEGYGITGGAMHVFEDEDTVSDADLADDPQYDADEDDDEEYDLTDKEKAARQRVKAVVQPALDSISENDASLMRLQKLAGLQILSEGRDEDLEEDHCFSEEEDHMEEGELEEEMVMGVDPDDLDGPPPSDYMSEEDQEEGMIYELEDGTLEMRIGEKRYTMQELEEVTVDLDDETAKDLIQKGLASSE